MKTKHRVRQKQSVRKMQNSPITCGTFGGTLLSLLLHINTQDIIKTILLATVGAIVSFIVSVILKCLLKKHTKE